MAAVKEMCISVCVCALQAKRYIQTGVKDACQDVLYTEV